MADLLKGGWLATRKKTVMAVVAVVAAVGAYLVGDVDLTGTVSAVWDAVSVVVGG